MCAAFAQRGIIGRRFRKNSCAEWSNDVLPAVRKTASRSRDPSADRVHYHTTLGRAGLTPSG
eukprot:3371013-Lingulodinium_polyedra.AAC.1